MKTKVLLVVSLLVLYGVSAQAAGIRNSKHDLSSGSTAASIKSGDQNQTCVFCHTPHNALVNKLLWNRINTNVPTTMYVYTSYNTSAMRTALTRNTLASNSTSMLCLSCHSISSTNIKNVVTNAVKGGDATAITSTTGDWAGRTGGMDDLRNDHPVGISYSAAKTTAGDALVAVTSGANGKYVGDAKVRLFNAADGDSVMECGSCHAVHDSTNAPFLAMSNTGSALCRNCHNK